MLLLRTQVGIGLNAILQAAMTAKQTTNDGNRCTCAVAVLAGVLDCVLPVATCVPGASLQKGQQAEQVLQPPRDGRAADRPPVHRLRGHGQVGSSPQAQPLDPESEGCSRPRCRLVHGAGSGRLINWDCRGVVWDCAQCACAGAATSG